MSIAMVCFTGDSGLTDYSVSLARELAKQGKKVTLYTSNKIIDPYRHMGFDVQCVFRRSRHYLFDMPRFLRAVCASRPQVLLWQSWIKFPLLEFFLVLLLRAFRIKCAITIHDVLPHYPRPWSRVILSYFYRCFNGVIVHSEAAADAVKKMVGSCRMRMLLVPHGVYDVFKLDNVTKLEARRLIGNIHEHDLVILFFGHIEPRKGIAELLTVAERMHTLPHIKFLIAGASSLTHRDGNDLAQFERARGAKNIVLHDVRIPFERVQHYFMASDLVVMPYREGTTSGVLKLALAFELPVVATRVGDIPEQVPAGGGELYSVLPDPVSSLEGALARAIKQQATMASAMRNAGSLCAWKGIAARYQEFLLGI
jgi:glycosyltransferase involved in cell wall biosynthesis